MSTTKKQVKIVIVGAGSSFGIAMVRDILMSEDLKRNDCSLVLVDIDEPVLEKTAKVARMFRDHLQSAVNIESTPDRTVALPNADFVIVAVERDRFETWELDYRIPIAFGFKHILGENGGPGAMFHALRNYEIFVPILRDMERLCPNALLLNFTNPESRILMAISRLSAIRGIGLCHGVFSARDRVAELLGRNLNELNVVSGGLNHFFWLTKVEDAATGEDLYPLLRERILKSPDIERKMPLVRKMVEIFGLFTYPSDGHIGEYLSFGHEFAPLLWKYGREVSQIPWSEKPRKNWQDGYISGETPLDNAKRISGEYAIPIIESIVADKNTWVAAVNVPNADGFVENLPPEAIVEVPAVVNAQGVLPQSVGSIPDALAAFSRTQVSIQLLLVKAFEKKSRNLLLQALLLDPTINSIINAEKMLDYMLERQKDYLSDYGA